MFSIAFKKAAKDYHFLINRGYNERSCKKFVGDHYSLSGEERSVLYRGVVHPQQSDKRKKKIITAEKVSGQSLHIDCLNIIYSISAYLSGKTVFISTDGLLRDAAEYHGKRIKDDILQQSLRLLFSTLFNLKISRADFFIDKPVIKSSHLQEKIQELFVETGINGEVGSFDRPDEVLWRIREGVLCSSDSEIIDRSALPVFDLGRQVIALHFNADLLQLQRIL